MIHAKTDAKLCHIIQTGQAIAWKETCIEFIKYVESRLEQTFINLLRFSFRKNNFSTGKITVVETILVAATDRCAMSWPVSNKYICKIY